MVSEVNTVRYEFGSRLKRYREASGLSQSEFAARIGVGNTRVSNWELGENRPDVDFLPLICEVLGVSPSDLLGIENNKTPAEAGAQNGANFDIMEEIQGLTEEDKQTVLADIRLLRLRREQR